MLLVLGLVLGLFGVLSPPASALNGTLFDAFDGNQDQNGGEQDWENVTETGAGATPVWELRQPDPATNPDDLSFGGGTNEDDADTNIINGSIPPNKSDIRDFYMATQRTTASVFTDYMYLGWERVQEPEGTTNFDFELNQAPQAIPDGPYDGNGQPWTIDRTEDDILITYDLSKGGDHPTIALLRWNTTGPCFSNAAKAPCWGDRVDLTAAGTALAEGAVNTTTIDNEIDGNPAQLSPFTFGEAAINLSDSGILPRDKCVSFASAFLKSRSSDSFTAEIKDFTPPAPVSISNCGKLTIVKDAQPDSSDAFSFRTSGGTAPTTTNTVYDLVDDGSTATATKSFLLFPGTYTTTETVPSGWALTGVACADAAAPNTPIGSAVTNGKSVTIASASDDITCVFTNQQNASITIVKDATPNSDQAFEFTRGGGFSGTFSLTDPEPGNSTSRTVTFSNLTPGVAYTVSENVPPGWSLTNIACSDGVTTSGTVATFQPGAGQNLTCTFSNTQGASLTIVKNAVPDDAQDFSFTTSANLTSPTAFTLDDDASLTTPSATPNTISFSNLDPGTTYTVTELATAGWDLTGLACVGGGAATVTSATVEVVLDAGGSMTCTYTNTERGSITIVKDAIPGDPATDFDFEADGFADFDITDPTTSGTTSHVVSNLVPGAYSVTELAEQGWDLTGIACGPGGTVTTATATADIALSPGANVTCTFTNTQRGTVTIVKDAVPNSDQDFGFTASANLTSPTAFLLDDNGATTDTLSNSKSFTVPPGTYIVTEDANPTGWQLTGLACTTGGTAELADRKATIVLPAGGAVTCTFTNTQPPPPPPPTTTIAPTTTTPPPVIDLAVTKVDAVDPITLGQNIDYTIVVTNNGPVTATGVTATDALPAGTTFVSATSTQGTCAVSGATLTCGIGTMSVGASVTISLTVTPGAAGRYLNVVDVDGDQAETNLANNHDEEPTDVLAVLPQQITTSTSVLGVQLARTGADAAIWFRLAGVMLIAGGLLVLAGDRRVGTVTRRR